MIDTPENKRNSFLLLMLVVIMTLRICSYFTLFPDSIGVTRVLKIGLRFCMTGLSFGLLWVLKWKLEKTFEFYYTNVLSALYYLAYAFLGLLSVFWSTNIGYSVLQLMMLFESIAFVYSYFHLYALYNGVTNNHAPFSKILSIGIMLISIVFLIGLYLDPSTFYRDTHGGAVSRLGGFIINPNELGMLAVIGAAMNYMRLMEGGNKFWEGLRIVINIAILLLTQSRSSLGAFLLVSGIFIIRSKNIKLQVATVIAGFFVLPILVNTVIIKEGDVGEVMSMTGRLPFWSDLITHGFPERPLLGYGFMSISSSPFTDKFDSIHAYAASMTHNTFVQVLINLGLVGAFIVLLQMIATFTAIGKSKNSSLKWMAIAMLIPLIINSLTEFGIFGEANYGILFYQFVVVFFVVKVKSVIPKRYSLIYPKPKPYEEEVLQQ